MCVELRHDGVIYVLLQACKAHAVKVPSSFLAVVPLIAQTVVMDLAGLQFNRDNHHFFLKKKKGQPPFFFRRGTTTIVDNGSKYNAVSLWYTAQPW